MVLFEIEGIFPEWPTQEQGFCTVHVLSLFMEHTDCFLLFTFLQQGANEKPNDILGCDDVGFWFLFPLFLKVNPPKKKA